MDDAQICELVSRLRILLTANPLLMTTGPVQARKACWGSGSTAPFTLNLSMEWGLAVISTPRSLYPQGKWSQGPLNRRQEGPTIRLYTFDPSRNQTTICQSSSHYMNSTNIQRYYPTRL
jgi:hypothetical protein